MTRREVWAARWVAVTAIVAWGLSNGLDVISVLFAIRFGGIPGARYHPSEFFLIYAGMRLLGTLAVILVVAFVNRHWASVSRTVWSALTACALMTAIVAWWRLHQ